MTMFLLTDASGIGAGDIDSDGAFVDLVVIANETSIGLDPEVDGQRQVTYVRTLNGPPQVRLDELVNTAFQPDYGAGPQDVDIIVISVPDDFVFGDGSFGVVDNGTALAPDGSGLAGSSLNPTVNCLVLYDTLLEICVARDGTGGTLDLPLPGPVVLYHELSHAWRIVRNELLALGGGCNPSSPEENAAITDENDLRTQIADLLAEAPVLRDPGIHCGDECPAGGGSCCIVASLVSGSPRSDQVQRMRRVRDGFLRRSETGHEFFELLHYDYYAFSPQVCTMIAGRPELRRAVLYGFVEPLVEFWEFMVARSQLVEPTDAELGAVFLAHLPPPDQRTARWEYLEQMAASWASDRVGAERGVPDELLSLLRERAWPRPSIQWALVRPVHLQLQALRRVQAGAGAGDLGAWLRQALDGWTAELPITDVWASLTDRQLAAELAMCDSGLFQTEDARRHFRERLSLRFPEVTAIGNVRSSGSGGT